jgi:hypothetical protein
MSKGVSFFVIKMSIKFSKKLSLNNSHQTPNNYEI